MLFRSPKEAVNGTELLFINFGEKEAAFSMGILSREGADHGGYWRIIVNPQTEQ